MSLSTVSQLTFSCHVFHSFSLFCLMIWKYSQSSLIVLILIDSISLVAKLKASASTLNSLSNSNATNKGLLVKTCFSYSNTWCCSFFISTFLPFLSNHSKVL